MPLENQFKVPEIGRPLLSTYGPPSKMPAKQKLAIGATVALVLSLIAASFSVDACDESLTKNPKQKSPTPLPVVVPGNTD